MIAGDADAVELRHVLRRVGKNVGNDPHRGLGRIDVGVPHHVFFEDVVLNCASELLRRDALLLGGNNVECHHGNDRAVHRHGNRHAIERNAVEEDFHVEDRVHGNTGLANIADDARVIAVITAMRGEVEGDAQPHLTGSEVATIERVAFTGGRETGILADGPGTRDIHRRVRAAKEWRNAGRKAEMRTI